MRPARTIVDEWRRFILDFDFVRGLTSPHRRSIAESNDQQDTFGHSNELPDAADGRTGY